MNEEIRITVLLENSVHRLGLVAEHGLAFHIQVGQYSLLFDTGQTDLAMANAETLCIPLDRLDAVVLSHGHYDHTGGLAAILDAAPTARVYAHPAAFAAKYSKSLQGEARFIGMNPATAQVLHRHRSGLVKTAGCTQVLENVFVTGEIPRATTYEDTGGSFFLDEACTQPDPLLDDQALFFDTRDGLVVLLGCAHAGVVNTLEYIRHITGGRPIHAVLGGMHLLMASDERMSQTIAAFRRWDVRRVAPAHCTGMKATAELWTAFPKQCFSCAVGTSMVFQ